MSLFESFTVETAPENAKEALQKTVDKYGQVMNIFADMAYSPLPIEVYGQSQELAMQKATLGAENVNLVQMAVSVENVCEFCVPAHSFAADQMKTDKAIVEAIRNGQQVPDAKIDALVNFTRAVVRQRGKLSDETVQTFLDAGFTKEQVFEIITIAAYKTITNYTSAIAGTKPNEGLSAYAWSPAEDAKKAA